jgi:hypothetical protein
MTSKVLRKELEQATAALRKAEADHDAAIKQAEKTKARLNDAKQKSALVSTEIDAIDLDTLDANPGAFNKLAGKKSEADAIVSLLSRAFDQHTEQVVTLRVRIAQAEFACQNKRREYFDALYAERLQEFVIAATPSLRELTAAAYWQSINYLVPRMALDTAADLATAPRQVLDGGIKAALHTLMVNDTDFHGGLERMQRADPLGTPIQSAVFTGEQRAMLREIWNADDLSDTAVRGAVTFMRPVVDNTPTAREASARLAEVRHEIAENDEREREWQRKVTQNPTDVGVRRDFEDIKVRGNVLRSRLTSWQQHLDAAA